MRKDWMAISIMGFLAAGCSTWEPLSPEYFLERTRIVSVYGKTAEMRCPRKTISAAIQGADGIRYYPENDGDMRLDLMLGEYDFEAFEEDIFFPRNQKTPPYGIEKNPPLRYITVHAPIIERISFEEHQLFWRNPELISDSSIGEIHQKALFALATGSSILIDARPVRCYALIENSETFVWVDLEVINLVLVD